MVYELLSQERLCGNDNCGRELTHRYYGTGVRYYYYCACKCSAIKRHLVSPLHPSRTHPLHIATNPNSRVSGHWQWILAVVILALAIIVGWIAACLLRRRYLRKKEREYELRPPVAPWANGGQGHPVAGVGAAPGPYPPAIGTVRKGKDKESTEGGAFVGSPLASPRSFGGGAEKKEKKWVVKERT